MDAAGKYCFAWSYTVFHVYAINTDLVAEGEIAGVRDLLDSRWRGRMISLDPRLGTGLLTASATARAEGITHRSAEQAAPETITRVDPHGSRNSFYTVDRVAGRVRFYASQHAPPHLPRSVLRAIPGSTAAQDLPTQPGVVRATRHRHRHPLQSATATFGTRASREPPAS